LEFSKIEVFFQIKKIKQRFKNLDTSFLTNLVLNIHSQVTNYFLPVLGAESDFGAGSFKSPGKWLKKLILVKHLPNFKNKLF
jgi:hypothetical protein